MASPTHLDNILACISFHSECTDIYTNCTAANRHEGKDVESSHCFSAASQQPLNRSNLTTMHFPSFLGFFALSAAVFAQQPGQIAPGVQHTGAEYGAYEVKIDVPAHARDILQAGRKGKTISIGEWKCRLDPKRIGLTEGWQNQDLELPIKLPGSLDTGGYGDVTDKATLANLHKVRTFVGPAWYQRDIEIPAGWSGKQISLLLERVMWESRVWVGCHPAGLQDSLSTPQHYDLSSLLSPGRHRLTIRVDNSGRPGANAHGGSSQA
jgi:hypothetical protein